MKKDITQLKDKLSRIAFLFSIPLLLFAISCNKDDDGDIGGNENESILQVAQSRGDLSTFVAAVAQFNDVSTSLDNKNETHTVFAPTDDAFDVFFEAMGYASLDDISKDTLKDIIQYHILSGEVLAADLTDGYSAETMYEESIVISVNGNTIMVNTAVVAEGDVKASNGVIHIIDAVLVPLKYGGNVGSNATIAGIIKATPGLSSLNTALNSVSNLDLSLEDEGETITLFAPTNDAFDALLDALGYGSISEIPQDMLSDILKYHVIASSEVMSGDFSNGQTLATSLDQEITIYTNGGVIVVNASTVISADIKATNGVVHVIDAVLVPEEYSANYRTLLDVAKNNENLSLFVSKLSNYPDLLAKISSISGKYTVFAPSNQGFRTLLLITGQEDVEDIPEDMMRRFLQYHISPEVVRYADLQNRETVPTILANEALISRLDSTGTEYVVDKAKLLKRDSVASNGVLHVIEGFLFPSVEASAVNTILEPFYFNVNYSTLNAAVDKANFFNVLMNKSANYTFFAPTNAGFEKAGIASLDSYSSEDLAAILEYHLHRDAAYTKASLVEKGSLSTSSGTLTFASDGTINGVSKIMKPDLTYQNGITHTIDHALVP